MAINRWELSQTSQQALEVIFDQISEIANAAQGISTAAEQQMVSVKINYNITTITHHPSRQREFNPKL